VTLPELGPHPGPEGRSCIFSWTARNELYFGEALPSAIGDLRLRCRRGTVRLTLWSGEPFASAPGQCGIAWKPDGTPTFLHGGELMRFAPCSPEDPGTLPTRCARTLLSRADLARELRRAGWRRSRFALEEVQWLTSARLAAIVRASDNREDDDLLVVFEGRRLATLPGFGYENLRSLRPSPLGTHVAARVATGGLAVVDAAGRPVRLAMTHGRAVTWSPDEQWIAEATDDGVYVFRSRDPSPTFVNLPIAALDLVWR
jgi:hypothetical protein